MSKRYGNYLRDILLILIFHVLIALFRVRAGFDITDGGFSLVRYENVRNLSLNMTHVLTVIFGSLVMKISDTLVFIRSVSMFLIMITSILSYLYLRRLDIDGGRTVPVIAGLFFSTAFILSMPFESFYIPIQGLFSVILVCFTLYSERKNKPYLFVVLGFLIGASFFLRLTLIIYIFPILIYFLNNKESEKEEKLRNIKHIILGFAIGLLAGNFIILITGKYMFLIDTIYKIIRMSTSNTSHNFLFMMERLVFNLSLISAMVALIMISRINFGFNRRFRNLFENKLSWVILDILMIVIFAFFYKFYGVGRTVTLFYIIVLSYIISIYIQKVQERNKNRRAFLLQLLIILFSAVGTTASVMYCRTVLFIALPVVLVLSFTDKKTDGLMLRQGIRVLILMIMISAYYLIVPYRIGPINTLSTGIENHKLYGIIETKDKADSLNGVIHFLDKLDEKEYSIVTHGSIPGIHYLTDIPMTLNNPWGDLASYSYQKYRNELISNKRKLIIIFSKIDTGDYKWNVSSKETLASSNKRKLLNNQILIKNMIKGYEDIFFIIYYQK